MFLEMHPKNFSLGAVDQHPQLEGFGSALVAELGQVLQARCVVDDDTAQPHLGTLHRVQGMCDGECESSNGGGVDPDLHEAHALVEHEGCKGRTAGEQAVHGARRRRC